MSGNAVNSGSNAYPSLPRYKCHKIVHALKIAEITPLAKIDHPQQHAAVITPAEDGYAEFTVDGAYMKKHEPRVGGYYVVYEDGHVCFVSSEEFESNYRMVM